MKAIIAKIMLSLNECSPGVRKTGNVITIVIMLFRLVYKKDLIANCGKLDLAFENQC